jgi:hypothetical protein
MPNGLGNDTRIIGTDIIIPIPLTNCFGPSNRGARRSDAAGDDPKSPASKSAVDRNAQKIPTKIAGIYHGGELIELRVRDRIAYLIKPTGTVDPQRRWLWEFPFWLGINDGFGNIAHRGYIEKALAAGFHVAGVDV